MDEKTKKAALKITGIITLCCLALALGLGVLSRWVNVSDVFYYIIAYIALFTMLTDTCIRKKKLARLFMVLVYSAFILLITVLIFFRK